MEMTYTWFWRKKLPDRKNTDCLIIARGTDGLHQNEFCKKCFIPKEVSHG